VNLSHDMKYSLSFCEIIQLSENIFEAIENEDVVIDGQCVTESWNFWNQLRTEPFGLLVHCSEIPLSFLGAQKIGNHPLQQKTALLLRKVSQEEKIAQVMDIKEVIGTPIRHQIFYDREQALEWLKDAD
jgi:hypothetical protein